MKSLQIVGGTNVKYHQIMPVLSKRRTKTNEPIQQQNTGFVTYQF